MAEDAVSRIGAMLEELGARFELVIEAVSGYGGRLDALRNELIGQFAEVGGQIRFLTDQIAENRSGIASLRSDLGAEMIRLGEALGSTRVEFREQMNTEATRAAGMAAAHLTAGASTFQENFRREAEAAQDVLIREMTETAKALKRELATAYETSAKKLTAEIAKTNKSLQTLNQKFGRFDDRITVQTRDQDQRLKKLERKARA